MLENYATEQTLLDAENDFLHEIDFPKFQAFVPVRRMPKLPSKLMFVMELLTFKASAKAWPKRQLDQWRSSRFNHLLLGPNLLSGFRLIQNDTQLETGASLSETRISKIRGQGARDKS